MSREIQNMYDGYPGRTATAKHQTEQVSDDARPLYSARYGVGPAAKKFAANKVDPMLKKLHQLIGHNRVGIPNYIYIEEG